MDNPEKLATWSTQDEDKGLLWNYIIHDF